MKVVFVFGGVSWFGCTSPPVLQFSRSVVQLMCTVILLFPQDLILPNGGTPAGTASPASSSSLLNRLQLDDDVDGETRDLFVTVDDPKKHVCTMETYITYRITTKVGPFVLSRLVCPVLEKWSSRRESCLLLFPPSAHLCSPFSQLWVQLFRRVDIFRFKRVICKFFFYLKMHEKL